MGEAFGGIPAELGKKFEEAPGWFYLLLLVYGVLYVWDIPSRVEFKLSTEGWAASLTLIFYILGDLVDKAVFDAEQFPIDDLKKAQTRFGVEDGIYKVAMKIAKEAGREKWEVAKQTIPIHVLNELAKTFRSFILLLFVIIVVLSWNHPIGIVFIILAFSGWLVATLCFYPWLKNCHRIRLYRVILALSGSEKPEISYEDVGGARMFFWGKMMVVVWRFDGPANGLNQKWIYSRDTVPPKAQ